MKMRCTDLDARKPHCPHLFADDPPPTQGSMLIADNVRAKPMKGSQESQPSTLRDKLIG